MAARAARRSYEELARHISGIGAVRREMVRGFPRDCPPASAAVLTLLHKYGEMRMGRLSELMAVDMSVTSRHVSHIEERGWVERHPDPQDGRSRLLRLTERGHRQLDTLSRPQLEALEAFFTTGRKRTRAVERVAGAPSGSFGDSRARFPHQGTPQTAARH